MLDRQTNVHAQFSASGNQAGTCSQQFGRQMRTGTARTLRMDQDLKLVMEFMLSNVGAAKLVAVAQGLAAVAPVFWGHYEREEVRALALEVPPIGFGSPQSTATGSAQQAGYALDGSVAGGGGL